MRNLYLMLIPLLCIGGNVFSQVYQTDYWDGYLSIKVKNDSNVNVQEYLGEGIHPQFDSLIASFGITGIVHAFKDTTNPVLRKCFHVYFSDSARMDTLITRLQNYPYLEYVSKSKIGQYYADAPDDSKYKYQWAMQKILADSIWNLLPGDDAQIKIAVIDDAFLLGHEDLAAAIDTNYNDPIDLFDIDDDGNTFANDYLGWDFSDSSNNVLPPSHVNAKEYSHGTHCAIVAGGVTNNANGTGSFNRGNIKIIPIKNAADASWSPMNVTIQAMQYAKSRGANIISMSFEGGSNFDKDFMQQNPQIIFVVSVGNLGVSS